VKASTVISCLAVIAAAVVLMVTKSWPSYSSFLIGPPGLVVQDTVATAGTELGAVSLTKGKYYVLSTQSDAFVPYTVFFTFQNNEKSKMLIDDARLVGPNRPYESVIKADRDDPAAQLTVGDQAARWARPVKFRRVSVSELNPAIYVWRRVIRDCAIVVLLAAGLHLLWRRLHRPGASTVAVPSDNADAVKAPERKAAFWQSRRAGTWAVILLVAGIGFDGFFLQSEHSPLITTPFRTSITGWDGSFYYYWLRSVMVDGDIDFTNELLYINSMPADYRLSILAQTPRTKTGLIPDKYPIGWALLSVPWYMAADLSAQFINWCGGKIPYDGFSPIYQIFLVLGQIVYATASLYLAGKILSRYLPPAFAVCGLILGWLGSPLFFYQTVDLIMAHNVMFFAMMGAYYYAYRLRDQPEKLRYWLLVGFLSAFVILSRYQGAIMLLFPGIVCLQETGKNFRRLPSLLSAALAGAVPIALQMFAWKLMYGSYFLYTYTHETFSWLHPHLFEVLFSPFHGLFNWHPMMLIGFIGFLVWAVRSRRYTEAICFTLSLVLTTYINAAWDDWWFGASFGSRPFETCTFFSMIGIGYLLTLVSSRAIAFQFATVALLLVALWNMNMMWMSQSNLLPFEAPVTWQQRIDMSVKYWSAKLGSATKPAS
jgi:hypothetical protein